MKSDCEFVPVENGIKLCLDWDCGNESINDSKSSFRSRGEVDNANVNLKKNARGADQVNYH